MELILEWLATLETALTSRSCPCRITTLYYEAGNQTVEDRAVVVSVETQLEEVARCDGCLFREDLELDVTGCGVQNDLRRRWWLEIVRRRHHGRSDIVAPNSFMQLNFMRHDN